MSRNFCIGYGVVLLFVCLLTAVIYYFLPLPGQCLLGGHYQRIGTTSFNVAVDNGEPAQITIQCWFPIGEQTDLLSYKALLWTSGHPQHELQESFDLLETCAHNNKLPSFSIKHLSMVRTNSIWQDNMNSLVQSTSNNHKFPIAIYSHGLWGWRQIHHTACENLASRGFVVFACDHTPDSMCSRICAGASERFAFPTPPGLEPDVERKFFQGGMERRVNQLTQIITHMQSDAFFTEHPELRGKLDYDNIHLWGHSYGGGTISSLCCRDTPFKIRSAVMLDGWIYPVPEKDRLRGFQTAAMLHLSAELWPFGKVRSCSVALQQSVRL
jgi:dienelactone hydrolase